MAGKAKNKTQQSDSVQERAPAMATTNTPDPVVKGASGPKATLSLAQSLELYLDALFPLQEPEPQIPSAATASGGAAAEASKAEDVATLFDAKAFLRTVPNMPGCYRMYGKGDVVIYVGKAKDLKKRLSSYFVKRELNRKTQALVSHITKIEFTVTFSESEALILENELIKKYMPHYNILLRDDKSYPYLHLTSDQEFAGIYFYRGARRKGGEYFGPFPDSSAVKDSLRLLQKIFPIRQCLDGVFAHRSRPCLMAQMGRCLAPCVPMTPEQVAHYHEQVDLLRLFLQGHNQELLQSIVAKMEEHAEKMEFEEAARLRDQLTALRRVQESNAIVSSIDYPLDVIGFAQSQGVACVHVLFIRNGRIFGTRSFFPQHTSHETYLEAPAAEASATAPSSAPQPESDASATSEADAATAAMSEPDTTSPVPEVESKQPEIVPSSDAVDSFEPRMTGALEVLLSFLSQFYLNESHASLIPDEVVVDFAALLKREAKPPVAASATTKQPPSEAAVESPDSGSSTTASGVEVSGDAAVLAEPAGAGAVSVEGTESGEQAHEAPQVAPAAKSVGPDLHVSHHRGSGYRRRRAAMQQPQVTPALNQEDKIALASRVVSELKDSQEAQADEATLSQSDVAEVEAEGVEAAAGVDVALEGASGEVAESGVESVEGADVAAAVEAAVGVLQQALKERFGKQVRFVRGARGSKRRFVELAMTNAKVALESRLSSRQTSEQRVRALEKLLGMHNIQRMECYDISHTMGELTVGSCVVFNREGPDSVRYRRYNITGITPGDDFAAMHQVLTRRFRDPDNAELPDLIFIDGGRGQLRQAEAVLSQAFAHAKSPMPVIVAVAKGEGRKEGLETLIRAFSHERINLDLSNPALQLVLHIRDESHRFAITGHCNRRTKARRSSSLESIAGVGPKRRQALLKHLGGMQEVKRASVTELEKVPGISHELAQKIYEELHGA